MNSVVRACLLRGLFAGWLVLFPGRGFAATAPNRPLSFEPHAQAGDRATWFTTHVSGQDLSFGFSGTISKWHEDAGGSPPQPEIIMSLAGTRRGATPQAVGRQKGITNHLVGPPERWRRGLPLFEKIRYPSLYSGIDLIYYGDENGIEYDFVVAPGASWRAIRLAFPDGVSIDAQGDLVIQTQQARIRHRRPRIYQIVGAGRRTIPGRFILKGTRQAGFDVGAYDPDLPLVIDPMLVYASYLGGNAADNGYSVAVDGSGSAYTVGETWSTNFPLRNLCKISRPAIPTSSSQSGMRRERALYIRLTSAAIAGMCPRVSPWMRRATLTLPDSPIRRISPLPAALCGAVSAVRVKPSSSN